MAECESASKIEQQVLEERAYLSNQFNGEYETCRRITHYAHNCTIESIKVVGRIRNKISSTVVRQSTKIEVKSSGLSNYSNEE
jgi:hypothetical protein